MDVVGKMRERVSLQKAAITRGSLGGEIETWVEAFTAYAAVDFLTTGSDERYRADQLTNRTAANITMRKEDRIVSAKDRVVYRGLIYEVDSVIPTGVRHEYLILECFQMGEHKTYT
jgi:SPP1 family predicted phage head-tail adaptor